jgi:pyruvate formate lyase activating enzyme
MANLATVLDELTVEGTLYQTLPDKALRCYACGHRCLIKEGRRGICKVRFNQEGKLRVPWGYVAGLQSDPIEKKPFFHILPGCEALTFGMLGCDFHCSFCQNWVSSQALRESASEVSLGYIRRISAEQIVQVGRKAGASVVASSYNEPLITSEWAVKIFQLANQAGMKCVYVSNGNATPEVMEYLRPHIIGYKIDLKTMQDRQYRRLGGVLQNVLDSIRMAHEAGLWVEVVTLIVPGLNDSTSELMEAARYINSISPDIPWHVTAYHPDFKMRDPIPTPASTLLRAAEIGQEAGLNYVYAGNLPHRVNQYENTYCPKCNATLIKRTSYVIQEYNLTSQGTCPNCKTPIPGIWSEHPEKVLTRGTGLPRWMLQ